MNRVSRLIPRTAILVLVALAAILAGCHSGVKDAAVTAKIKKSFDVTVQAYKDDQFMLNGAVLSPLDLKGAFAYMKDQGNLPKRVLLTRSDDTKIHKSHVQSMARLQYDFGFAVYTEKDGELHKIEITNKNDLKQLKDTHKSAPLPDRTKSNSAAGGSHFPTGGGY